MLSDLDRDGISLATRERVVVSVFDHNSRLVIDLGEASSDESDDAVFEIRRVIEEYRFARIDMLEGFLKMGFCRSLASLIQVLEF